jgi:hypothetical protein
LAASSLPYPIVTRKEAQSQGLKRFFTGEKCKHGHLAERQTGNMACVECAVVGSKRFRDANVDRVREYAIRYKPRRKPRINKITWDTVCSVQGCSVLVRSKRSDLCNTHYFRKRRSGRTDDPVYARRYPASNGYIVALRRGHKLANSDGTAYEHRFVYYDLHGEGPFACHWCAKEVTWDTLHIDHLNDVKHDNRGENLVASCAECNIGRGRHKLAAKLRANGIQLTHNGVTKCVSEWARDLKVSPQSMKFRLKSGWDVSRAVTQVKGTTGPPSRRKI